MISDFVLSLCAVSSSRKDDKLYIPPAIINTCTEARRCYIYSRPLMASEPWYLGIWTWQPTYYIDIDKTIFRLLD